MKKISTTEENNNYYKLIHEYIDEYIDKWKIKPSNLKKYFKNSSKVESFLKKYKLDDVDGIKRVLLDVIEDREALEKDGIVKFESFKLLNEDLGQIQIDEANISHERILADVYHTSVGHINVINQNEHKYEVSDFGNKLEVIIYSPEDIKKFKSSLLPIMLSSLKDKTIDLHKVDLGLSSGKEVKCGLIFEVGDLVEESILKDFLVKSLSDEKVIGIITSFINDYPLLKTGKVYKKSKTYKNYVIWELEKRKPVIRKAE